MERTEILDEIKHFFDVDELVCNHTLARHTKKSWKFLDTMYLWCLLVIRRDILRKPMYCNNHSAGQYQRGLRCNMCQLVKDKNRVYLSGHIFGKAGDFTVVGMTAEEAREKIKEFQHLLPCPIRLEEGVSWLHFDVMPNDDGVKVFEFTES
jgi:hypothetical protein